MLSGRFQRGQAREQIQRPADEQRTLRTGRGARRLVRLGRVLVDLCRHPGAPRERRHVLGRQRPRVPARGRDHAVHVRGEQVEDARAILVRLQRDQRNARAEAVERGIELGHECAHPVRVVRAVS